MIRSIALLAMPLVFCVNAAQAGKAPLAVYYSFDTPAPAALVTVMQDELGRIFAPSGVSIAWRKAQSPDNRGEDFPGVAIFRFIGRCTLDDVPDGADPEGQSLGETAISDGHVLPFATVNCDRIKAFIAPKLKRMPTQWKTEMMGRALARVSAHEIYHMLAGVAKHDDSGIFRPVNTRTDLTTTTFSFAPPEQNWLRAWQQRQTRDTSVAQTAPQQAGGSPDDPGLAESGDTAFAGR